MNARRGVTELWEAAEGRREDSARWQQQRHHRAKFLGGAGARGELIVRPESVVRSLIRETGRRVIAEDREALAMLTAYDRGARDEDDLKEPRARMVEEVVSLEGLAPDRPSR